MPAKFQWAIERPDTTPAPTQTSDWSIENVINLLVDRPELMFYTRMLDPEGWESDFMAPARRRRARRAKRAKRRLAIRGK